MNQNRIVSSNDCEILLPTCLNLLPKRFCQIDYWNPEKFLSEERISTHINMLLFENVRVSPFSPRRLQVFATSFDVRSRTLAKSWTAHDAAPWVCFNAGTNFLLTACSAGTSEVPGVRMMQLCRRRPSPFPSLPVCLRTSPAYSSRFDLGIFQTATCSAICFRARTAQRGVVPSFG